jgi:hypothetical protein
MTIRPNPKKEPRRFSMAFRPNRKRKPSCHHNLADKPDSDSLDFGKPDEDKKTPPPPRKISKMILISLVLGGVAMTAIFRGFDGLIEIKLGLEGGQVLIDGRKPPLSPPITNNSSNTK